MTTKKEATRLRLLEAGKEMAIDNGALPHIDIRLTDVLAQVGLTTGAAYNIWGSQDEFRTDLATDVAKTFSEREFTAEDCQPDIADGSLEDCTDGLAEWMLTSTVEDMAFYLPLRFWGVREVPEPIAEAIREGYARSEATLAKIITQICDRYGLDLIEGRSVEDLASMTLACLDGVLLRNRFTDEDPASQRANIAMLAAMLLSLFEATLVPKEMTARISTEELSESALAS